MITGVAPIQCAVGLGRRSGQRDRASCSAPEALGHDSACPHGMGSSFQRRKPLRDPPGSRRPGLFCGGCSRGVSRDLFTEGSVSGPAVCWGVFTRIAERRWFRLLLFYFRHIPGTNPILRIDPILSISIRE